MTERFRDNETRCLPSFVDTISIVRLSTSKSVHTPGNRASNFLFLFKSASLAQLVTITKTVLESDIQSYFHHFNFWKNSCESSMSDSRVQSSVSRPNRTVFTGLTESTRPGPASVDSSDTIAEETSGMVF